MIQEAARTPILFVDDEPSIVAALRRTLRVMRNEWDMEFATTPADALAKLSAKRFEVVVSDMAMPGMSGAELLAHVREESPRTARIILSAQTDQESFLGAMGTVHQFLAKPCDPDTVRRTIERARRLQHRLDAPGLADVVGSIQALPSPPRSYAEVIAALDAPGSTAEDVACVVARDPGLVTTILKLVNSALFGLRREITDIQQAVALLGMDTVRSLATSAKVMGAFADVPSGFDVKGLWDHCLQVARVTRRIARELCDDETAVGEAFLAAVLHDSGKLALAANLPRRFGASEQLAKAEGLAQWQAELRVFGTTHAEVGACLLGLWGLPEGVVDVIGWHHQPGASLGSGGPSPAVTVLHVADALVREIQAGDGDAGRPAVAGLDHGYLDAVGAAGHLPAWRELVRREVGAT